MKSNDIVVSLLRGILQSLRDGAGPVGGISEEAADQHITEAINALRGSNEDHLTLAHINSVLHDLTYGLYNNDSEEGSLGDIIALRQAIDSLEGSNYILEENYNPITKIGYRKWSNGKLEQWGISSVFSEYSAYTTINMPKEFINTDYTIISTVREQMNAYTYAMPQSTKAFKARVTSSSGAVVTTVISWRADGYWK